MLKLQDKQKELEHDKKIKDNAEFFWGWATPAGRIRADRRAQIISRLINLRHCKKVLEIGCGTGIFTKRITNSNIELVSIDISEDLIVKLKKNELKNTYLAVADAEKLPFQDNYFDAIFGCVVLHHLNIDLVLPEIMRIMKKGAYLVFSEPNMLNPQLFFQKHSKILRKIMHETDDETAFLRWQLHKILKNNLFVQIKIIPFDFLHPWTPKFLIPLIKKIESALEKSPLIKEVSGSLLIYAQK